MECKDFEIAATGSGTTLAMGKTQHAMGAHIGSERKKGGGREEDGQKEVRMKMSESQGSRAEHSQNR